jgi:hypothetical protein
LRLKPELLWSFLAAPESAELLRCAQRTSSLRQRHVINAGDSLSCTSPNHAPFFDILKFFPLQRRAHGVMAGNTKQP